MRSILYNELEQRGSVQDNSVLSLHCVFTCVLSTSRCNLWSNSLEVTLSQKTLWDSNPPRSNSPVTCAGNFAGACTRSSSYVDKSRKLLTVSTAQETAETRAWFQRCAKPLTPIAHTVITPTWAFHHLERLAISFGRNNAIVTPMIQISSTLNHHLFSHQKG